MKKKITVLTLYASLLAFGSFAQAQRPEKVYRIGYLSTRSAAVEKIRFPAFVQGLRELGYAEGKNIVIEQRYTAAGQRERLRELAAELVRLKVDVTVVSSGSDVWAVKDATTTIPIVFAVSADPVGEGLVQSLARPGGNITGLSDLHAVLVTKRLELLKEAIPSVSRVAFLWNSASTAGPLQLKELQAAAPALGVTLLSFGVKGADDFDRAFAAMRKDRPGALVIHGDAFITNHRDHIIEFTVKSRLPAIWTVREHVEAGGLMSYGAYFLEIWRRAATYVDKILKGAKPADLPVEQPTKFELVINLKTAKQIGLTIPQSVLYRADKVIK
jgi:putative ABC transport system substrate-binding protein